MNSNDAANAENAANLEHLVAALRADLQSAAYYVTEVEELLGAQASAALQRTQLTAARVAVQNEPAEPLAHLIRIFLLGEKLTNKQVDAALPRLKSERAQALGLIDRSGAQPDDSVQARVDLRPYAARDAKGEIDWWILADQGEEVRGSQLPSDHVLGVGGAGKTLAGFTVRDKRPRALDLGTGGGIQALHLSRHCETIVATDISQRALNFAKFNLALNDIAPGQVELRTGSMLEPVAGDQFDLIVSNPPFVITPPDTGLPEYEYRDGSLHADSLVENLFSAAGQHLTPGGVTQFLGNWEHRAGQDWKSRLEDWLEASAAAGFPVDAWIVEREVQDPAQYAETWLQDGGADPRRDRVAYERAYAAWLVDFASRDVEGIGFGYVLLRRPEDESAPQLREIEHVSTGIDRPLGHHVLSVLRQHDLTASLSETELLQAHFEVAADVTEERHSVPGASDPTMIFLHQGGGYGRSIRVSTWQAAFAGACDGELSAGQICGALAQLGQVDVAQVIAEVLPFLRDALHGGFIVLPTSHTD